MTGEIEFKEGKILPPIDPVMESDEITELLAALVKATVNFEPLKRKAENPHIGKKYADLQEVINSTKKPLADNGLIVIQSTILHGGVSFLETKLSHVSGQWKRSLVELEADTAKGRSNVQAAGSAMTYMRRYQEMAILNIAPEDDDGHDASQNAQQRQQQRQPQRQQQPRGRQQPPPANNDQQPAQKAKTPKEQFIEHCKGWAIALSKTHGNQTYRTCIRTFGFEHANEFPDNADPQYRTVLMFLKAVHEGDPEGEYQTLMSVASMEDGLIRGGAIKWDKAVQTRQQIGENVSLHALSEGQLSNLIDAYTAIGDEANEAS